MGSQGFGVDVGGSGIKGCPVDLETGTLIGKRLRIATPEPSTPDAVAEVVARIVEHFGWTERTGVTIPCVVKSGTACTAANVDPSWIGTDAVGVLGAAVGRPVLVLNDADAAGLAEMRYGAGRDAEDIAAASVKEEQDLSWPEWTPQVSRYLRMLENLVWPDLIIVGGGVSKQADRWLPLLDNRTPVVAAQLRNAAGIVGAALAAADAPGVSEQ